MRYTITTIVTILTLSFCTDSAQTAAASVNSDETASTAAYVGVEQRAGNRGRADASAGEDIRPSDALALAGLRLSETAVRAASQTPAGYSQVPYLTFGTPLAFADTQDICGVLPPAGWITISVNRSCARAGGTYLVGRTIRRIENLPAGTTVDTCGDLAPAGWVTTSVNGGCAKLGIETYISSISFNFRTLNHCKIMSYASLELDAV